MSNRINVTIKLFVTGALLAFCTSTVMAAKDANDGKKPASKVREPKRSTETIIKLLLADMTTELGLTKEQQDACKAVLEDQVNKTQKIRIDKVMTEDQKMAKVRDILKETRANLEKQMTDEQKKKFVNMTFKKIARGEE